MTRVLGKASNRMYRLDTEQGSFAVKELDLDRDWAYPYADVFRLEQAAFAAGIPMPEPISADADVLVHRWVDGEPVPEEPVTRAFAFEIGEILARLHLLGVSWHPRRRKDPETSRDWPDLATRAKATGQPWAVELAGNVDAFLAIAEFVDACERHGPVVLTHRDIHPWNLLARAGRPVVLDWEISGWLDLGSELGSTALSLSKGHGFEKIDRAVFRAALDGYASGGGTLPTPGPGWFAFMIAGWLGFTRRNILRCLDGMEANAGPELAMCHEEVRNGLRGLPDMFSRLPALEKLLF